MSLAEELLEKHGLPANLEAERTILGLMIDRSQMLDQGMSQLKSSDFSSDVHRRVFDALAHLFKQDRAVDTIVVKEELDRRKELSSVGGPVYVASLTEMVHRTNNLDEYINIIRDKALSRGVLRICQDAFVEGVGQSISGQELANSVAQQISDLSERSIEGGFSSLTEVLTSEIGGLDAMFGYNKLNGFMTGFTDFDQTTKGLKPGNLIIIAARPGMGKTTWALNVAQNAGFNDDKVIAFFSLEMTKMEIFMRLVTSEAEVDIAKLSTGFISPEEKQRLMKAVERLLASKVFVDDTSTDLTVMKAQLRRLRQKVGRIDLVVIDYLQRMKGSQSGTKKGYENKNAEVSAISDGLKSLAKELRIPVMALSQLSRDSEKRAGDKVPLLSDLRDSGAIEQDGDLVAFLHRESYYDGGNNPDTQGKAHIIISKHRNGPTAKIPLSFRAEITRFRDLSTYPY